MQTHQGDQDVAWAITDHLVRSAQEQFRDVYDRTAGDDGYVSFELDPLLESAENPLSLPDRTERYRQLGRTWSRGQPNRMIKVPATPAGLASLEELVAAGVSLNVTLIFTMRQYRAARDAVWRGAQRRDSLDRFKSVYSIFVSRIDVYTKRHIAELSDAAQGLVGIVNAKNIWRDNQQFWAGKNLPLKQEIIFASTGTKDPGDRADKYVAALAGSDIQTNPPATSAAVQKMAGRVYTRTVDALPPVDVLDEIRERVDIRRMEDVLMAEGLRKFCDPQQELLSLIAGKRGAITSPA